MNDFEPVPKMPEKEQKKADEYIKTVLPLVKRLDKTTRELLYPALADGQTAFVLDAKLTSKQLQKNLPATEKPMPILNRRLSSA